MAETLSYFINNERYSAPSLVLLVGETEQSARRIAEADLAANPRHLEIEVRVADTLLFRVQRPSTDSCEHVWCPDDV